MNRLNRYTYLVGFVLVLGGLALVGAAAGVRMSFGLTTQTLDCATGSLGTGVNCMPLLRELNSRTWTFLTGGAVAIACGLIAVGNVRRQVTPSADNQHAEAEVDA